MTTGRRLRVVHLTWRLSATGGIPLVIRRLVARLEPDEVETTVVTVRPRLEEDRLDAVASRCTVVPLDVTGQLGGLARLRVALRLDREARRRGADVVHLHSGTAAHGILLAARRRTAVVLDVHDAPGNGRHGRRTEWIEGWMCRRLGVTPVVHSTSVATEVVRSWRLAPDRAALVPLGIEVDRFRREAAARARFRRELAVDDATTVVLYVARLVPSKDVDAFVDVAHALRDRADLRFVVVGGGPEEDRLRRRAADPALAGRLQLLGSRDGQALVDCFAGSDVFVSTSSYEGFGLAVVEAMAAGLPVVAVASGGVTDLVDPDRTGYLVAPGDLASLTGHVRRIAEDPALARSLGHAGEVRASERFTVASMADHYLAAYRRIAG